MDTTAVEKMYYNIYILIYIEANYRRAIKVLSTIGIKMSENVHKNSGKYRIKPFFSQSLRKYGKIGEYY